jgi:hypothetical protein
MLAFVPMLLLAYKHYYGCFKDGQSLGFAALSGSWDDVWCGLFTWAWMTGNPLSLVFSAYCGSCII